jgi:hypothetical protein
MIVMREDRSDALIRKAWIMADLNPENATSGNSASFYQGGLTGAVTL